MRKRQYRTCGFRAGSTIEALEARVFLSAAGAWDEVERGLGPLPSHSVNLDHRGHPGKPPKDVMIPPIERSTLQPFGTTGPTGYSPAQIRHAYGIDQITFQAGTIIGNGAGQTIAIVDAYDDPNVVSDLHSFDLAFGIPDPPSFSKITPQGLPPVNSGWAGEIALDVEWVHAIAPGANIDLVEALSASGSSLLAASDYARSLPAVSVISMSFGGGESSNETTQDSHYTTPSGHQGITFIASTGDSGAPTSYPAASPNVLAVGGTTLSIDSQGNYLGESGWSSGGGGPSQVEPLPSYQTNVANGNTTRMTPDVAFDADPGTGVPVYDTVNNSPSAPWEQVGGTSLSSPCWAGLIAIANQGRAADGLGTLDGRSQTLPMLYSMPSSVFHDITSGNNGYAAGMGYDFVTGLGSPVANQLIPRFVLKPNIVVNGTSGNDAIYLQRQGNYLNEWINSPTPGIGTPTHQELLVGASTLAIHGLGGSDSITIDESGGNLLLPTSTLDDVGGNAALRFIGTTSGTDTVTLDGTNNRVIFNGSTLAFAEVTSLRYTDNGGSDSITCNGPLPITLDLTGFDSLTVNSGNVTLNFG